MTVETYDGPTAVDWVCPAGVTSVDVQCWGTGGAGGLGSALSARGGGGGGAYAASTAVAVTPGNTYPLRFNNSATTTGAASAHTAVTTGWTNPSNAFASTGNAVYATAVPGKSLTVDGDFGFADIGSATIPNGATVVAVRMKAIASLSASVTGGIFGIQGRNNGVSSGTEATTASLTDVTVSTTLGTVSLTDLRSASTLLKARCRGTKGNTNTALTVNLDAVWLEVDWSFTDTTFNTSTVVAKDGVGGTLSGGAGGTAAASTGTTKFDGGTGGAGQSGSDPAGGGGSSAGTAANGNAGAAGASGGAGGTAPTGGGAGGVGGNGGVGGAGSVPGGGGGGGGTNSVGGAGASGRIVLTYSSGVTSTPPAGSIAVSSASAVPTVTAFDRAPYTGVYPHVLPH